MRLPALTLALTLALPGCDVDYTIDGPPELEVGTGEFAYEAVADGDELAIISGSQGGFHLLLGVRMRNLDPNRVRMESSVRDAESGDMLGEPLFFRGTFFRGETDDWEYAGLPAQVEPSVVRGRDLTVTLTATDRDGRTVTDTMLVVPVD